MKLLRLSFLSLALAALGLGVAFAAGTTANLSWIAPTQYVDGTALPTSDLGSYTITWAPASGQSGPSGSLTVAGTALAATVPVPCGGTSFSVTVTTSSSAHYPNATSAPAGPVPYVTGVTCGPKAVTGLTVN